MELILSKKKKFLRIKKNGEDLFKISINLEENINYVLSMTLL